MEARLRCIFLERYREGQKLLCVVVGVEQDLQPEALELLVALSPLHCGPVDEEK